ncbi:Protein TIFY 10A [Platanthera zijinensis]|uniref:Protein TIFY n=1 Tax=Platanthera zijinensis TaxID=2320716 RepID=A0AAP0G160_9ASPA
MEEKQRKTGERSSFALTCSLLSQYLKENRSFGAQLGVPERLHCPPEMEKGSFRPPTTMNLFPGSNISDENPNEPASDTVSELGAAMSSTDHSAHVILEDAKTDDQRENEVNAQLTILYNGKVMVFDNFPAIKARDLVVMASQGTSILPNSDQSGPIAAKPTPYVLAMPIARRASLHRFLEKRRDRIKSCGPYLVQGWTEPDSAPSLLKKNQAWLALGHETSFAVD